MLPGDISFFVYAITCLPISAQVWCRLQLTVCFIQLPATLKPGVTVVISPLLSLIQDQIITLNLKFGIPATFLNSQQTASQAAAILQELRQGSVLSLHCDLLGDGFFLYFSSYVNSTCYCNSRSFFREFYENWTKMIFMSHKQPYYVSNFKYSILD